jgi:hypothetical protein
LASSSIALFHPFFLILNIFEGWFYFFREIKKKKSQATKGDCIMPTPTIKKIDVKFRHFPPISFLSPLLPFFILSIGV